MFQNYLIVAWRNLVRHKGYSLLNIVGLAAGMACCILVLLFVQDEFKYDAFHTQGDRIYRVISKIKTQEGTERVDAGTSGLLGPTMVDELPEVEASMRLWIYTDQVWLRTDKHVSLERFALADPNVFDFFSFPLLMGDSQTIFTDPYTVVISESVAETYFGDENPIGQMIKVENATFGSDYRVTGVMQDLPKYSTIKFDIVTATENRGPREQIWNAWTVLESWRPIENYVRLRAGASPEDVEPKLLNLVLRRYKDGEYNVQNVGAVQPDLAYFLQPLSEMRLYSKANYGLTTLHRSTPYLRNIYGDIQQVYLLSAIAFFVLAIACINFMNLTTARSVGRAQEVGLRKVVGAYRGGLVQQFLGESVLLALVSLVLALILVSLVLPAFNGFMGKALSLSVARHGLWLLGLLVFAVVVGLLAGSYPAFYLSSFEPVTVLKGAFRTSGQGAFLRKGLVVLQFSISIMLIISTIVAYRQLTYLQNKNLGFDKENVIMLPMFRLDRQLGRSWQERLVFRHETVKQAFLKHPSIADATMFRFAVGQSGGHSRVLEPEGLGHAVRLPTQPVDANFVDFFNLEIVAGRNFKPDEMFEFGKHYILNEAAVQAIGWSDPIGKKIKRNNYEGTVVGVVKDFHHGSLHKKIEPAALITLNHLTAALVLRVRIEQFSELVPFLKETWQQFLPERPFEIEFLDETLNRLYQAEQRVGKAMGVFALVAIGLACLGLFGLAAFTAEQRTKEIGVRKVLGASVGQVVLLLSKEFTALVVVANVIAWPVAYYALNEWLQGFAYRTTLGVDVFLMGGGLAVLIAFLTVSTLAIRAAQTNPVDALRYE